MFQETIQKNKFMYIKSLKATLILLFICSFHAVADVIYSPYKQIGTVFSLEGIGSYEIPFTKYNTVDFWGGAGCIAPLDLIIHPAFGGEIAIEFRHYFKPEQFKKFNLGIYSGLATMRYPYYHNDHVSRYESSLGFVPGLKLTYKHRFKSALVTEPYLGCSMPWYTEGSLKLSDLVTNSNSEFMITLGIRIGFNIVHQKK